MIFQVYARNISEEPWRWIGTIHGCRDSEEAKEYAAKLMMLRQEPLWKLDTDQPVPEDASLSKLCEPT